MKLKWISLIAVLAMLVPALVRADVHDNAQKFSQQALDDADRDITKMEHDHGKSLVIETFSAIPDDQKAAEQADSKAFFQKWMRDRAQKLGVNGVYVLICMDPKHLEVGAGKETVKRGDFTKDNEIALRSQLQSALRAGDYDKALSGAVEYVDSAYAENIHSNKSQSNSGYVPTYGAPSMPSRGTDFSFGSLICLAIGAIIVISIVRTIFRGTTGGGMGGGYYPPGNQGYGGNYGGGFGGGYGGGGGGGFGRGLLGGLLGGALGSYVENRFDQRNDQGNSGFFQGGGQQSDDSGGTGGSFDSGPSDAGQGFGDNSVGGDFGSSGGGDVGGGGGDSGGSTGGDF
jgi:hypothetical protein